MFCGSKSGLVNVLWVRGGGGRRDYFQKLKILGAFQTNLETPGLLCNVIAYRKCYKLGTTIS